MVPKKNSNIDYEIMIVGGGPAGISTWLHLQKFAPELADRTLLVEKQIYPRDKLCGGALHFLGQKILTQLGVDINIPSISIHNTEYRFGKEVFYYNEQNHLQIIRRIEFDYFLAKIARERGLQLNEDEIFIDASHAKSGLIVKTNRGEYKVKVLIGADGALSKVRSKMELPKKPHFAPAIEIFAPVNSCYDPEFDSNTAVIDFTPVAKGLQGYVWHFPCIIDGKPSMNHGICDTHINTSKPRPNLKKILSHELHRRKIICKPSSWSGYPVPWFADEIPLSQANILLVGDAAGIEPLIGGGIHLALMYGEVAAFTIIDAFRHNDFSFKEYNTQLHSHIVGKYIRKFTYLAFEVYNDRMNVIDAMKKINKR